MQLLKSVINFTSIHQSNWNLQALLLLLRVTLNPTGQPIDLDYSNPFGFDYTRIANNLFQLDLDFKQIGLNIPLNMFKFKIQVKFIMANL